MEEKTVVTIGYGEALQMLEDSVDERGWDHVYEKMSLGATCANVHIVDGEAVPGCIVGHALITAGHVTAEYLRGYKYCGATSLFAALKDDGIVDATDDAVGLFRRAQVCQDRGVPWGAALAMGRYLSDEVIEQM